MSVDYSGEFDIKDLTLPATMLVDYVRVYQRMKKLNIGVNGNASYDPDTDGDKTRYGMPTAQYIACHRDTYITRKSDNVLITEPCNGARPAGGYLRVTAAASALLLLLAAAL